jgi:hypothetical protein
MVSVYESGVDAVLEAFGEKLVECPNPDCDGDQLIDAQEIIARPGCSEENVGPVTTPCCDKSREELFEIVDPDDDREPMEDAYAFEAEVSS